MSPQLIGPRLLAGLLLSILIGAMLVPRSRADETLESPLFLPILALAVDLTRPLPTWSPPPATPQPGPGVPACDRTQGDAGGFRFSLDGGRSLAPAARRLDRVAYTWAIDIDPRDPNVILELHQGAIYRSADAGCRFEKLESVPEGGWDRLARAPSQPDLWVLSSVFESRLAWTEDAGSAWKLETLPDDVHSLAISPDDPWRWTFAGRQAALYSRGAADEKFEIRNLGIEAVDSLVSAAQAPGAPDRWIVGSNFAGLFRSEDAGRTWLPASEGLFGQVGEPPEPVTAVVPAWIGFSPADPDRVYTVVNRVARNQSERGIWRSQDGGKTWSRRVGPEDVARVSQLQITGGTRVFLSPHDPEHAFFALGVAFGGFGTDLFRSQDGLASLAVSHFDDFYDVHSMGFGPAGSGVVYLGSSSNIPSAQP